MKTWIRYVFVGSAFLFANGAHADCLCKCVGGQNRSVCSRQTDIPLLCATQICPPDQPSLMPQQSSELQQNKTCRRAMIANSAGNYVPQMVCK